jgi:ABC-type bacteriocin/lantibiotic exporter with double-glycine peptidase domain
VDRGTILVEAINGIRTIKYLSLDSSQRHQFVVKLASVAERRYDEGLTTNLVQILMHPLEMMMSAGIAAVAVGGFKRSSQHGLFRLIVGTRHAPRQVFSSRASCEACR